MSAITDELHSIVSALETEGHVFAARLREIWQHLTGDVPALEAEAVADGEQVVKDAETAAAPVVAEAEGDAKQLLNEAEADVKDAVTPPTTTA